MSQEGTPKGPENRFIPTWPELNRKPGGIMERTEPSLSAWKESLKVETGIDSEVFESIHTTGLSTYHILTLENESREVALVEQTGAGFTLVHPATVAPLHTSIAEARAMLDALMKSRGEEIVDPAQQG